MVFYAGGIYNDPLCENNESMISHQVVVVGWGTEENTNVEYWIVRNSWSNVWGVDGYIYIQIDGLYCAVTAETTIPVIGELEIGVQ